MVLNECSIESAKTPDMRFRAFRGRRNYANEPATNRKFYVPGMARGHIRDRASHGLIAAIAIPARAASGSLAGNAESLVWYTPKRNHLRSRNGRRPYPGSRLSRINRSHRDPGSRRLRPLGRERKKIGIENTRKKSSASPECAKRISGVSTTGTFKEESQTLADLAPIHDFTSSTVSTAPTCPTTSFTF
jgi:hypothetical protein